ncbi:uncharacterized protein METZ01_LOCUS449007 [marine metagenome]|uniref:Uncharacterized protein n=1 Tax=marine metagenome TaxID=408172 RepID=A0A382ZL43_9ZZZZ
MAKPHSDAVKNYLPKQKSIARV